MKRVLGMVVGALLALGSGPGLAAPDASVQMLMNTPTPLMSFGLVRLETLLEKWFGPGATRTDGIPAYTVNVSYNAQRDRIVMAFYEYGSLVGSGEESCPATFAAIRRFAGLDEAGAYRGSGTSTVYARQFLPIGVDAPELAGVATALDKVLEISVMPSFVMSISCDGPLLGTQMTVKNDGINFGLPQ